MYAEIAPQVVASDDEDENPEGAAGAAGTMLDTDMDLGADSDGLAVRVNAIDAYWLQRQIAEAFAKTGDTLDAAAAQARVLYSISLLHHFILLLACKWWSCKLHAHAHLYYTLLGTIGSI